MKNYSIGIADGARTEFHQTLGLTGAEVSFNSLPAGVSVPFVHSHKENEEIYIITEGKGTLTIDGEVVKIKKGNEEYSESESRCIKNLENCKI